MRNIFSLINHTLFKNFAKNPQCFIELRSPNSEDPERFCNAVISLMQRRRPASKVKGVNKVGFRIYRVDKDADELTSQFFSYRRNDGRHKAVAKTRTWQVCKFNSFLAFIIYIFRTAESPT